MTHIVYYILASCWLAFGFAAWGFQDGYMTWKHPRSRKLKTDILFILFDLVLGPAAFIATFQQFGFKHWTRRFWGKSKKDGWDMLETLEYYAD